MAPEIRAQVMAALLEGQGVNAVARVYKLAPKTVSRIKNGLLPENLSRLDTQKKESLDTLLLESVNANVRALKAIAEAVSEPSYITKQPAESVGMLYGILADKAVRFLEAASAANIEESETREP